MRLASLSFSKTFNDPALFSDLDPYTTVIVYVCIDSRCHSLEMESQCIFRLHQLRGGDGAPSGTQGQDEGAVVGGQTSELPRTKLNLPMRQVVLVNHFVSDVLQISKVIELRLHVSQLRTLFYYRLQLIQCVGRFLFDCEAQNFCGQFQQVGRVQPHRFEP